MTIPRIAAAPVLLTVVVKGSTACLSSPSLGIFGGRTVLESPGIQKEYSNDDSDGFVAHNGDPFASAWPRDDMPYQ